MNSLIKFILIAIILLFMAAILWGCYKIFVLGDYLANASFITSGLILIGVLAAFYFATIAIKSILKKS